MLLIPDLVLPLHDHVSLSEPMGKIALADDHVVERVPLVRRIRVGNLGRARGEGIPRIEHRR